MYAGLLWDWFKSPEFAGLCGLIASAVTFLGITIALVLASSWFDPYFYYLSDLGDPTHIGGPFGVVSINPSALFYNGCQFVCGVFLLILGFHILVYQFRRLSAIGLFAGFAFIIYAIMGLSYGIWGSQFYIFIEQFTVINDVTFNLATLLPFLVAIAFAPIFLRQDARAAVVFILFVVIGILAIFAGTFVFLYGPTTVLVLRSWLLSLTWICVFSILLIFRS